MTVAETFENMPKVFNPAAAAGLNKTIQVNLSGEQAGSWVVRIVNQTCEAVQGTAEKPDLNLSMSDQDWLGLVEGRLNAMQAFLTGKIKATGDLSLAPRLPNLFKFGN